MLPNHPPLVIAEQFWTLEALYPGRIDLGLGRAPGTDVRTLRALRRDPAAADSFPQDVLELQALLAPVGPDQSVQAVPGGGSNAADILRESAAPATMLRSSLRPPQQLALRVADIQKHPVSRKSGVRYFEILQSSAGSRGSSLACRAPGATMDNVPARS
jgi:alkanesulfonate monooxygenase SsuD/methylene tetrahydromethanopterin reductase-like flavin-dependent oxidoreductase (luciferase family)